MFRKKNVLNFDRRVEPVYYILFLNHCTSIKKTSVKKPSNKYYIYQYFPSAPILTKTRCFNLRHIFSINLANFLFIGVNMYSVC